MEKPLWSKESVAGDSESANRSLRLWVDIIGIPLEAGPGQRKLAGDIKCTEGLGPAAGTVTGLTVTGVSGSGLAAMRREAAFTTFSISGH